MTEKRLKVPDVVLPTNSSESLWNPFCLVVRSAQSVGPATFPDRWTRNAKRPSSPEFLLFVKILFGAVKEVNIGSVQSSWRTGKERGWRRWWLRFVLQGRQKKFPARRRLLNRQRAAEGRLEGRYGRKIGWTLTIHAGAFCLHPNTLSVRMMPVFGSTVLSTVSMLTTWVHFEFGYLCHIPITTWDQGWLAKHFSTPRTAEEKTHS